MEKFTIVRDYINKVKRYNLRGRTIEFKINSVPEQEDAARWIKDTITQIVLKATKDVSPQDKVGFSFCSKDFTKGTGWLSFQDADKVTVDDVWGILEKIFQSNSIGLNTDTFCLGVTVVSLPRGRGKRASSYNSFQEECGMRKGIVCINNKDNLCLPRALVVATAFAIKDPEYRKVRRDIGKLQTQRVKQLLLDTKIIIPENGGSIPDLQLFQDFLKDFQITVYSYDKKGREVLFRGPDASYKINLLHHDNHYNVITSLTAAFCCGYYCEDCHTPYNSKNKHRCGRLCPACKQSPACNIEEKKTCEDCGRWFRNQQCFTNHKSSKSPSGSVCNLIKMCYVCLKTIKKNREHTCGEIFCKICKVYKPKGHLCYMKPDTNRPKTEDLLFIFYDLETRQETKIDEQTVLHEPNLCVFKQCCNVCMNNESKFCDKCGVRLQILRNNPISNFIEYVLNKRKHFKNIVIIAHNGQAFDHQFILNHILTKTNLTPELIMRGSKIISMVVKNIKFLDSLNYFPMALAKLPKTFGLGDDFKKGYFPHLFNTLTNENYTGPLPDISYYCPDSMKNEDRIKFLDWYESNKNNIFDMKRELVEYCISDVEILTKACLKFRDHLISTGNVCPFTEACTIASACNKVFRRNFLTPDTIGLIPKNGYRFSDIQSKIAIKWMLWEEKQRCINILHAAKEKEVVVNGIKVDGFCVETNQIFEFHGCYFHGHNCLKYGRDTPLYDNPHETLNTRYESTIAKSERLKLLGYELIEMWECDLKNVLTTEINQYTDNHPLLSYSPLNPRDSFFGGRTGNIKTYYKIKENEKIKYIDVCSLYPWVCKNGKFPVGHPKVLVGDACPKELTNVEGLIKCKILPPQNLFHPVLPIKSNDKLIFALCRTCANEIQNLECTHNIEDRALSGTWVIDEVIKAIEKGYIILETYEIWKYDVEQYDLVKKTGGIFTSMMNKFLKIKQQASGWPKDCKTQKEKERYIEEFFNTDGIQLESGEILENPGLRALAKLMLNSFWGKLGQRENQPKTKIVNDPGEFFSMLCNSAIQVNSVLPINENTLVVNYEYKEETYDVLSTVNVCLASYTTAQARLKLYSYLEKLEDRVLYYDTDSVVYISRPGEYNPPLGKCVGDMTDELESYGEGSHIIEFASAGPKSYGYLVYSPPSGKYYEVCKIKGITLNHEVSKTVNFEKIKNMILNDEPPVHITYKHFERTDHHEVVTRDKEKLFKVNCTKRKFEGADSIPFGYKIKKIERERTIAGIYIL